ncbi:MAG: hypothetical protein IPK17_12985 [Chloroflexi bacterium]|uniref:hypothetical protein n=1 Tax=Candidatus Flexifilum breve TaxID=3140694 RepID=UPI003136DF1D|nr:hypothetical protein [Chloroflexota bacterium]
MCTTISPGVEPPRALHDPTLPVTLYDTLVPLDHEEQYVPNHLDADGTVHFFAAVDVSNEPDGGDLAHELRYFRAAQTDDGRLVHDAHPVMPLDSRGDYAFPRQTLETMLMDGDLDNAQELAYQTARSHGLAFPEPEALPALKTGVDYAFEVGVGDDGDPALEAVKRWREGAHDHEVRQPIAQYGMSEEAARDQAELDDVREARGLEAALNLAESMAVSSGALHDGRADPRFFTDGPPDPFTTNAERERTLDGDTQRLTPVEPDAAVATFEERFEDSAYHLLQPVDPTVNYSFEVMPADPWTLELTADKWWLEANGHVGHEGQTLKTYSLESYEWEREIEREIAAMDRENLHRTYQDEGLEAAMRRAEGIAVANGELNAERADGRLFTDGPPDRFTTAREAELVELDDTLVGEPLRDITNDETAEIPGVRVPDADEPEPGSWDELVAQQRDRVEPEREQHYWQMHYRPVETPEGEPLGTALFVTEFPQLPPDFDDYIEANGMDDSVYPTEARTLEMAHFANADDAHKFETEFRSYLVPGLLDGPELAPEVAKLEGLSGEWEDMDYRGIVDYMSSDRTVVREVDDWHLHNPNAEREVQAQFETDISDIDR